MLRFLWLENPLNTVYSMSTANPLTSTGAIVVYVFLILAAIAALAIWIMMKATKKKDKTKEKKPMGKFILVHEACNGNPLVINASNIAIIEKSVTFIGCSKIQLNNLDVDIAREQYDVAETPEKIFEMLK